MSPQMVCPRWCIVTLVTFVLLFSSVRFQMCPQIACLRGCIITLVAFVWLFPTVYFHMSFQMAFVRGRIIALFTFVHFCDIFSPCCGDFHILFAQAMVFNHIHSLHLIVLLPMATPWYWCKSEVLDDIGSVWKRESVNSFQTISLEFVWFFSALCLSHWNLIGCAFDLLVQNFDPYPAYKKSAVSCNSCFQLKAHWFWILGTEIESESQNRFSRPRKFGPPQKIIIDFLDFLLLYGVLWDIYIPNNIVHVWWDFVTDIFPPLSLLTFSHHGGILSWWECAG